MVMRLTRIGLDALNVAPTTNKVLAQSLDHFWFRERHGPQGVSSASQTAVEFPDDL